MNVSVLPVLTTLLLVYKIHCCGYDTCPVTKPSATNVHLICHTHWDAGWVRTFDEYYDLEISKIIPSVLDSLSRSPDRRFTFVESSFIARWWRDQSPETKAKFMNFLKTGQITFTSGGWVMNDMASPRYQTIIDQMTLGHQFLNETFGECGKPRVGWQIDPFGHSKEQASLFAEIGFDGQFLGRIDYQDKDQRRKSQKMEFIWDGSRSLGDNGNIFTSTLMELYSNEEELCFDVKCDNQEIHDYNVDEKMVLFWKSLHKQKAAFKTNHIAFLVGGDFHYLNAERWYRNLDKLIGITHKEMDTFNVFYSNPQCYIKAVHESKKEWKTEENDFFPYADKFNAYWSGYFTSRPSLKYNLEYSNNVLQAAKQLTVLANLGAEHLLQLRVLMEYVAIVLHHDGISGTSKQYVAEDYSKMLYIGVQNGHKVISSAIKSLLHKNDIEIEFCNNLNTSECSPTETFQDETNLIVYNPLAHAVHRYIALPVSDTKYRVTTISDEVVSNQVVPVHDSVTALPDRRSTTRFNLYFHQILPPLSLSMFSVTKLPSKHHLKHSFENINNLTNGKLTVTLDPKTGLMSGIIVEGKRINISQNFHIYDSAADTIGNRYSGAYMLRVQSMQPKVSTEKVEVKIIKGKHIQEIQQTFTPWISQTIRLFKKADYIEFEWFVGPIPVEYTGREVISRFDTDFDTKGVFFTDANARETLERKRNWRSTWNIETQEFVGSNYYPVTGWIYIRDLQSDMQLTLLPDRCQGGSSLKDGSIELMVHRRLLHDDFYGVNEPLNEPGVNGRGLVATGKHRLFLSDIKNSVRNLRVMHKTMNFQPILAFAKNTIFKRNNFNTATIFEGLTKSFPPNLHLLTLEHWENNMVLIRIEHLFEINEDSENSRPRRFSLQTLFKTFRIKEAIEMNLSVNERKEKSDQQRLKWKRDLTSSVNYTNLFADIFNDKEVDENVSYPPFIIIMNPMEIKTFLLKIDYK